MTDDHIYKAGMTYEVTPPLYWTVWYNLETAYFLMLAMALCVTENHAAENLSAAARQKIA